MKVLGKNNTPSGDEIALPFNPGPIDRVINFIQSLREPGKFNGFISKIATASTCLALTGSVGVMVANQALHSEPPLQLAHYGVKRVSNDLQIALKQNHQKPPPPPLVRIAHLAPYSMGENIKTFSHGKSSDIQIVARASGR